jgi:hypothetical protein
MEPSRSELFVASNASEQRDELAPSHFERGARPDVEAIGGENRLNSEWTNYAISLVVNLPEHCPLCPARPSAFRGSE